MQLASKTKIIDGKRYQLEGVFAIEGEIAARARVAHINARGDVVAKLVKSVTAHSGGGAKWQRMSHKVWAIYTRPLPKRRK